MAIHYMETMLTSAARRAQERSYGRARPALAGGSPPDALGPEEESFVAARDSFYLGTVNEDGWPYIQHRGGPAGFLRVVSPRTLAFADYGGNRQLLTAGNLADNPRVSLFLMDYPARERLKILGHARVVEARDEPDLAARVSSPGAPAAERVFVVEVEGFDWNCPKFITPRYTAAEVEKAVAPLRARIAELERAAGQAANPPSST